MSQEFPKPSPQEPHEATDSAFGDAVEPGGAVADTHGHATHQTDGWAEDSQASGRESEDSQASGRESEDSQASGADTDDAAGDTTALAAERTGNHVVDQVLDSLGPLGDKPVDEHVAVFEQAHEQLRGALDGPRLPRP